MSRKNIKLNEAVYQRHQRRKQYYGLTWAEYLDAGCPTVPEEDQ